jgi:ribosomal protein L37AE/L43A
MEEKNKKEKEPEPCPKCGSYNLTMFTWGIACNNCEWTTFELFK